MTQVDEDFVKVIRAKMIVTWLLAFVLPLVPMIIMFGFVTNMIPGWLGLDWMNTVFIVLIVILCVAPIIAILLGTWWGKKYWENYDYELEVEGIRIKAGVITKVNKFIPYKRIQDLAIRQSYWERRYGISSILIETAGYGGGLYPEGVIPGLKDPEPVMDKIRSKMSES